MSIPKGQPAILRKRIEYEKTGFDDKKREVGNLICPGSCKGGVIIACSVKKTDAEIITRRHNTFSTGGVFKYEYKNRMDR